MTDAIATLLDHQPADARLFERALTHGSHGGETYERLEFLGDRVLGLVVAAWLYERFPDEPEGKMSRRYNALVARETCAMVGRAIDLPRHIRLGKQAREDHAGMSDNVVGDVVEALMAAIYIDGGLEAARAFFMKFWAEEFEHADPASKDVKNHLQEWAQSRGLPLPKYEVVSRTGPDHAPCFTVSVSVEGYPDETGTGRSRQDAEKAAALCMLARREGKQ